MFKKNVRNEQFEIFGQELSKKRQEQLNNSIWTAIRTYVLEQVDEKHFSVLYSSGMGRPNAPVNIIITLLTIKELYDWSFRELENQMEWHIGVQYACGMTLGESEITLRTITNFIKLLRNHQLDKGIDLFDLEFKRLVKDQITGFALKTRIARTDSTYIDTNVIAYNRLQFLIEVVKRVFRILEEQDKQLMFTLFPDYVRYEADHYVYALKSSQIQEEFTKIGHCFQTLPQIFKDKYTGVSEWELFLRVYGEQFKQGDSEDKLELKPPSEMTSDSIRCIDDPEATLRFKSGTHYQGFVAQIVETADPDNELNLVCCASVSPNNASDEQMLTDSFVDLKEELLPALNEVHFDGGYGGAILDDKLLEYEVKGIQTGIRGVKTDHRMDVFLIDDIYQVICPVGISAELISARKGYKAEFSKDICNACSQREGCPIKFNQKKDIYVYYIQEKDLGKRIRLSNIKTIPKERRTLRSGVEATVRQFKCHTKKGKSRLRGRFRHQLWVQFMAFGINLKRIYNYLTDVPKYKKKQPWVPA